MVVIFLVLGCKVPGLEMVLRRLLCAAVTGLGMMGTMYLDGAGASICVLELDTRHIFFAGDTSDGGGRRRGLEVIKRAFLSAFIRTLSSPVVSSPAPSVMSRYSA